MEHIDVNEQSRPASEASNGQAAGARIVATLLRSWWLVLAAGIVGGIVAFGYSATLTPQFTSTSSTYFSIRSGTSGSDINQGSTYTQNQMLSFAELATSATVLEPVTNDLDHTYSVNELRRMISVSIPQNTVVLEIGASSSDPQRAADIANGVAQSLADSVAEVAPTDSSGDPTIEARVIDPAVPAATQSSPNKQRDAVLGAFAGGVLAVFALIVWSLVDTRVRSEAVLRRVTNLPVLARIPRRKTDTAVPVVATNTHDAGAEAYRGLRSSLRFSAVERPIVSIAIASSVPREGKTTTSVNLALAYAESGMKVLLVDLDLRRPRVAESLGVDNAVGVTTMLVDGASFETASLNWGEPEILVLPAGELAPNVAQLLASEPMASLIADLSTRADVVIFDTAPLLSVADTTVIAPHVDAVLLVVDSRRTTTSQVGRALDSLAAVGANVSGIVLSRTAKTRRDAYAYAQEDGSRSDRSIAAATR